MFKKGSCAFKIISFLSTFLLITVTLFYTTVSAFAVQNYSHVNDTVYRSANAYALEELPYGEDTAVVQITYNGDKYVTLYFDKLTIYQQFDNSNIADRDYSNLTDYYWNITNGLGNRKKISILSDSPIYYNLSYDSDSDFTNTVGELTTKSVISASQIVNGNSTITEKKYSIYSCESELHTLVGESLTSDIFDIHSNKFMVFHRILDDDISEGTSIYYYPVPTGKDTSTVGAITKYFVSYYPTLEYLNNAELRQDLILQWNELIDINASISDGFIDVLTELYNVNFYLSDILTYSQNIYFDLSFWLPMIDSDLIAIYDILAEMKSGPEYDSSQGIGSNTEFGDAFGNLTEDTVVPGIGTDSIVHSLGNSFLFIRNMFDKITVDFNLVYIITFLLGLSFIAYVLGRVIRNKMNG